MRLGLRDVHIDILTDIDPSVGAQVYMAYTMVATLMHVYS